MKNPIKLLQEEHKILLSAVQLGLDIQKVEDDDVYHILIRDFILFIRNYTEIYHFPKEEDILYPMLRNRSENMNAEFMHEICDEHEDFKAFVAEIEIHYTNYDHKQLRATITHYLTELFDHMNRENKIILTIASKLFSDKELEKLYDEFVEFDSRQGEKKELEKDFYKINLQES